MAHARAARVGVAAPNKASADAALAVADLGGGAVDAAVAAMLVATVNEPGVLALAGGAYVTVWPAGADDAITVDGHVAMPGLGRPPTAPPPVVRELRTAYGGDLTLSVGHGTVATPGTLAALDLAHQRYGRVPWQEVVGPAEAVAREGFVLGGAAGYYLSHVRDSVFAWDPETAGSLRHDDGSPVEPGERMVIPGLADTMALVARQGARTMYDGELAAAITADMTRRGGRLTSDDLVRYRPIVRPSLGWASGGWELRTNPPPAIGGAVLAAMLLLLDGRPGSPWTADDVARLVQVQRRVLDHRRDHLDVADDREAAANELLAQVGVTATGQRSTVSPSTVHVSVVDADGTACAITSSSGYGSGGTVPGTGLWLNNCLGEHELNRGAPPPPGSRLASNMAPTVGRSAVGDVLAIGSPGADRITTALAQVLAAYAHGHTTLQEAIDRPRLHVRHLAGEAGDAAGPNGPVRVEAEEDMPLPELDLPVVLHPSRSMYFGGVAAAHVDRSGHITAAADPRRAAVVAVSPG